MEPALAVCRQEGELDIRVIEVAAGRIVQPMDMSIRPGRLNLEIENGLVRRIHFDPETPV